MPEHSSESAQRATVKVSVEPEKAPRFIVGTRWEVVESSLDSLWQGAHTVTLKEIETEGGDE